MQPQDLELLLVLALILLLGLSFYTLRFWLKLREAMRESRKIIVLQTLPVQQEAQAEAGGLGFLPWFVLIVLGTSVVALYR